MVFFRLFFGCEFFNFLYLIQMNKKGSDLVGRTVKGYKIIKSIGEGKFSEVYRAENEDKNPYALKNIKV